ncbi:MAG: FtsW/RodA/SpoVE family cell cycle protein [Candidatus Paceibacterota bacterium]
MPKKIDKTFLLSFLLLLITGLIVFVSASMGIYARDTAKFTSIIFSQMFFGLFLGLVACFIMSKINYRYLKRFSFYIFILSVFMTLLVFVPGIGVSHGGASRWIYIGTLSFQPLEFLKIGFIIYFAAWISGVKDQIKTFRYGLLPFIILMSILGGILLKQPDTDSFIIIFATGLAMYLIGGAKWRHIFLIIMMGIVCLVSLFMMRPYLINRLSTFLDPSANSLTSGYQIQQSLIAVGSGQVFGRGLGQSVQKFKFLPESVGDAIFPIAAEEFGFIGSIIIILLFIFFASRGLKIAGRAPDQFGGLLVLGIVILITIQSFINIASMIGVIPLSGSPLIFFSQGGTALMFALLEIGIILNISKYQKLTK